MDAERPYWTLLPIATASSKDRHGIT